MSPANTRIPLSEADICLLSGCASLDEGSSRTYEPYDAALPVASMLLSSPIKLPGSSQNSRPLAERNLSGSSTGRFLRHTIPPMLEDRSQPSTRLLDDESKSARAVLQAVWFELFYERHLEMAFEVRPQRLGGSPTLKRPAGQVTPR